MVAGQDIVDPIDMLGDGYFHVGLATCYDLRFSEMSTILRQRGANVLTFPSAFTVATGAAGDWMSLLKARAIENQCYVIGKEVCKVRT